MMSRRSKINSEDFGKNQKLQFPNFAKNYLTPPLRGGIISLALTGEVVKRIDVKASSVPEQLKSGKEQNIK
jgi:hypothetical protein